MAVLSRSMQAAAAAACCMVVAVLVVSSHQAGPTSLLAKVPLSAAASTMMWFQREHPRTAKVMGERGLVQSALKATEEVKQYGGLEAAPTPALSSVAQQQLTVQDLPANWFSGGVALSGKEWGSVLGGALERANSLTRAKLVASRAAIGPEARCDQQSHCTEQGLYSRILSIPAVHQGGECPADVECELHQVFLPCHSNAEEEMEDPVRKEALCPLYVFASPAPSMAAAHTATLRARAAPKERSAVEHGATRPTQQAAPLVSRDTTDAGTLQGSRGKYVYPQDGKHYFGEYAPAGKGATLRSKPSSEYAPAGTGGTLNSKAHA
ncbi:hypothetical protein T484DRAFT_1827592 [Baffinella frigidus]|nr:hypothetical protein T484DRAFT_1827592 [Cryptophyta sp. CCMP2293]